MSTVIDGEVFLTDQSIVAAGTMNVSSQSHAQCTLDTVHCRWGWLSDLSMSSFYQLYESRFLFTGLSSARAYEDTAPTVDGLYIVGLQSILLPSRYYEGIVDKVFTGLRDVTMLICSIW